MSGKFTLIPANNYIWNQDEFIKFLIEHQGQPITINTNNEGVCLETAGVYRLLEQFNYTNVIIYTANWLETHPIYKILPQQPRKFFNLSHVNYQSLHSWNKQKIFGCFYNRPLWHRIGLAAELQQHHNEQSLINVRANPHCNDQRMLFELTELFKYAPESLPAVTKSMTAWPCQVENTDTYTVGNSTNGHSDQIAHFYPNFLIDVVAETWIHGRSFYPTEKTIRPMLLKKPFIVMGSRDYLAYLRQLGFWTFDHFWNENYDGYSDRDRYIQILELINLLAKKSKEELYDMYCEMEYVLEHNYNLLKTKKFQPSVKFINE